MEYLIIAIIILIVCWFIYQQILNQKKRMYVLNNSPCIASLIEFNKHSKFKIFDNNPRYKRFCNSKSQLDNFNIDNHMLLTIEDSTDYFVNLIKAIDYNRQKYQQYEIQYNNIIKKNTNNINYESLSKGSIVSCEEFIAIEKEEIRSIKMNAILDFNIELIVCYTSPRGRNSYFKTYNFSYNNIKYYLEEYNKMQVNKQSASYQRKLMTPKMRYQVMQRDGFKCVICGRTQNEGAKLHVDHIKPVSKGGKTEASNLRTLCDMCNLGKGDSYNPNGLN